jgi:hypothetical protein
VYWVLIKTVVCLNLPEPEQHSYILEIHIANLIITRFLSKLKRKWLSPSLFFEGFVLSLFSLTSLKLGLGYGYFV